MQAAIFFVYFLFSLWLISRLVKGRDSGFSPRIWLGVFCLKVLACVVNLYLYNHVFPQSDAAFFYWQSMAEIRTLPQDPGAFFREWLLNWGDISGRLNVLNRENLPYWNNLGSLWQGKFMTACNLLSFGQLYVNTLFYSLVFFTGQWLLYRRFYALAPDRKHFLLLGVFLLPSVLFWCSGIHKDGWVLAAIGGIAWFAPQAGEPWSARRMTGLLLAFPLLFAVRYFYFFCLIPAFACWMLSRRHPNPLRIFALGYGLVLALLLCGPLLPEACNPLRLVVNKQEEFLTLKGFSDIYLPRLEADPLSFLRLFPRALYHIFWMPGLSAGQPLRYNLAGADNVLLLALILLALAGWRSERIRPFHWFALFLALSVYLFIGYTIPNSGALVRYKSEFTALLLPALFSVSLSGAKWSFLSGPGTGRT